MPVIGLDIGTRSIKLAQLEKKGAGYNLVAAGITPTPGSGIASDSEQDINQLVSVIKKLMNDTRCSAREVNISLTESKVFTKFIKLPYLTDHEVDSAIAWQAEPYVPIPINDASIDYTILRRIEPQGGKAGNVEVLLVAAPKSLIKKYMHVAEMLGLTVRSIETELFSLSRSIVSMDSTVVLADLGSTHSSLGVVRGGEVVVSHSIPTGGDVLTRAVSSSLNMSLEQAEEYKKAYGLNNTQLEGKVAASIGSVFSVVVDEIKKAVTYFKTEVGDDTPVASLILSGGISGMPEIVPFLAERLSMEVLIGDPFVKVAKNENFARSFAPYSPMYGVAVGLAMDQ